MKILLQNIMTNSALRLVFFLCIFIFCNKTGYSQNEPVIYKLFPSLEKYLSSPEGNNRHDICGFAIQYKYGSAWYDHDEFANDSMFILYRISYITPTTNELFNETNKYIEINNNYYPVFIMHFDNSFSLDKSTKNNRYREEDYNRHFSDVETNQRLFVNIVNKTFYEK